MAKVVILRSGPDYLMVVLPAPLRVDLKRVRQATGMPDLHLATEEEVALRATRRSPPPALHSFPEGRYGAGPRGGFTLTRFSRGQRGNEWLLMKRRDERTGPAWRLESELSPRQLKTLRARVPPCEVF
ncbi:MAG: YbaK/EbsC family protein [Candidatus Binatia bacterium]